MIEAAGLLIYRVVGRGVGEFQYLLLQASYRGFHWTPPKGHVDPGEDKLTTARRETEEEAGLSKDQYDIDERDPFVERYNVDGKPKTVYYWIAKMKDPDTPVKISHEHQDFRWCNVEDCVKITFPDMGDMIRKTEAYLKAKNV